MKGKINIIIIVFLLLCIPIALYFYIVRTSPLKGPGGTDQTSNGSIRLDSEKEQLLESLVKNHKPLVEQDQKLKDELIKQENPIYETPDYVITYDKKDDMFQVLIKTIKISTVQDEVVTWFKNKGFSGAAVCILPVQFSIDKQNAESLRGRGVVLNPLPPGC